MEPLRLTRFEEDAADVPTYAGIEVAAEKELLTLTTDSRRDSAEMDSIPPFKSPGPDETPVMPWRARWARWRCRGVCLPVSMVTTLGARFGDSDGGVISMDFPSEIGWFANDGRGVADPLID